MDGECLKLNSNSQPNKRGRTRVDDRISELPKEIIVLILSFLSVKEAAATSLLSPQWRNLWKQIPILNFSSEILNLNNSSNNVQEQDSSWDPGSCEYVKLVNSVLESHRPRSLNLFKVSFYVNRSAQSEVEKWLDFMLSTRVESMELDLQCWKENNNKVVLGEYLLKHQKELSHCTEIILFKSLKRLSLRCLQLGGEDIKILLHSCPLLNVLIINVATLTSDIEICGPNLALKELEIYACRNRRHIKVSAPNLTWICVDDYSILGKLMLENFGKLCRARFVVRMPEYVVQRLALQVSCFISQLQVLTLTLRHTKFTIHCYSKFPTEVYGKDFPKMPNLWMLVVEELGDYDNGGFLHFAALIWAAPRLQKFYLRLFGEYKDSAQPHMETQAITNVERKRHRRLRTFKFQGPCRGVSDRVVEMATYFLKNCSALGKIVIRSALMASSDIGAEVEARDSIKLQLQPKLNGTQLQISRPI